MSTTYTIKQETLTQIGDAIREKNGTNEPYCPSEMAEAISRMESGGMKLNIAYGDTEPEDTAMLWVKTATPTAVKIQPNIGTVSERIEIGVGIIPAAATGIATAAVGTNIYLFGGYCEEGWLDTIYTFDTKTNTLTKLETVMPVATSVATAVTVGKKVYLFGGSGRVGTFLNTILEFDSEANTISTLSTTLPRAACRIGAAAVGKNVYLFGGMAYSDTDAIQVFNTETNAITTLSTTLPNEEDSICAVAMGTKIYLIGGSARTRAIYAFDTETNTISTADAMIPTNVGDFYGSAAAIGAKIYLFGGRTADNNRTDAIAVYDPESDTVAALDASLPGIMDNMGAAAVGTSVYLFGGDDGDYLNAIHKFVAAFDLPNNHILIETSLVDNLVELIAESEVSVQIGIANVYWGNAECVAEKVSAAVYKDGAWSEI